jgi:hypothetical protein
VVVCDAAGAIGMARFRQQRQRPREADRLRAAIPAVGPPVLMTCNQADGWDVLPQAQVAYWCDAPPGTSRPESGVWVPPSSQHAYRRKPPVVRTMVAHHTGDTMTRRRWTGLTTGLAFVLLTACTPARVAVWSTGRVYHDPRLSSTPLSSMAVLPLQNTRRGPQIAIALTSDVVTELRSRNPHLTIMGPAAVQERLNATRLIGTYAQFLRDYGTSGLLDTAALTKIAHALGVDALVQGEIAHLDQHDGDRSHPASTTLTLHYSIIALKAGVLLWDSSVTLRYQSPAVHKAPDLEDVVPIAHSLLLTQMPTFP